MKTQALARLRVHASDTAIDALRTRIDGLEASIGRLRIQCRNLEGRPDYASKMALKRKFLEIEDLDRKVRTLKTQLQQLLQQRS